MASFYQEDLAYIQATGFADFARSAAPEILGILRSGTIPVRRVFEVGCGAGPLTVVLVDAGFQVIGIDVSGDLLRLARTACADIRSDRVGGAVFVWAVLEVRRRLGRVGRNEGGSEFADSGSRDRNVQESGEPLPPRVRSASGAAV